ncbi:MAG TPA: uracil-DNA glycosylase [Acidobacteriota bacterium]|nr:uracil-DNA glycosylase [Acidobacteriota bacterium]
MARNDTVMETGNAGRKVACHKCRYYKVTWDPQQPYGCLAHGFKTHRNPAIIVYETSGIECQLFEPKTRPDSDS